MVIMENGFAPVAPAHDVVNRSGIFHSEFPGHAGRLEEPSRLVHTIFDNAGLTQGLTPKMRYFFVVVMRVVPLFWNRIWLTRGEFVKYEYVAEFVRSETTRRREAAS